MIRLLIVALLTTVTTGVCAQSRVAAEPVVGLRDNRPTNYALIHARVVAAPGQMIEDASVLIEDTSITAVGQGLPIPAGYMTLDCSGRTIYAGLIDAFSEVDVDIPQGQAGYWNKYVTPERAAHVAVASATKDATKLRSQGITTRLIAPKAGIVKGSSAVVLLGDGPSGRTLLKSNVWQHLQLSVPRSGVKEKYPNSPMGAVALLRQSMYDATWYTEAWTAYRAKPSLPRPETNVALDALSQAMPNDVFVVDAPNERMALRAEAIAKEFSLQIILRGSGREYRSLDQIAASERPVLVPVDFPDAPSVATTSDARNTTLEDLMHWELAPENPARLASANVPICLTTDGLSDVGKFLKQVRKTVDRGLPADKALAALTTVPAELLGIAANNGRVQAGMVANLMITDGDLFDDKTKVLETWVAGKQFVITTPKNADDELVGTWKLTLNTGQAKLTAELSIELKDDKLTGSITTEKVGDEADRKPVKLNELSRERDRMTASIDLHQLNEKLPGGQSLITVVTVQSKDTPPVVFATVTLPSGTTAKADLKRIEKKKTDGNDETVDKQEAKTPTDEKAADEKAADEKAADEKAADEKAADEKEAAEPTETAQDVPTPVVFPLGAFGFEQPLAAPSTAIFRGATIWTCDDAGIMTGDILIRDGKIVAVGESLAVPADCQIIDGRGKHITPGLIDCHSHMGTDGGINESGQAVTAEVRIGDFIDNSDMNIYRQLAGGVTTSNILHGSANPIGGQNQVIKLRWGDTMEGLRMQQAPAGIKFALGENVKRSTSRYPNTRMGVEQIIRDQLLAAREYDATWRRWREGDRTTLPPRIDLQLEALAEVQRGERWIHCHSYRQDEIVATLEVLEEFGIQIGTLQHILEGYKVADRMAKHGAMGSAFSDWWAYKFEVFDAIPYNGALMHEQGVVVSFNSDDRELARHLNTEAAKAVKYGGIPEAEAFKFVTLNPAKQLRIEQHVGSITPGKDADLVVWSGKPMSTTSRCEQTWIDGKRYFDLESDRKLRARDADLHAMLVQKVLRKPDKKADKEKEKEVAEEDRWDRHDTFCGCHGDKGYGVRQ